MPLRKTVLKLVLWSLALTAVAGVFGVLVQGGEIVLRVFLTGLIAALACFLMMPISGMIDREKSRSAGLLGTAWVIGEFGLALLLIWRIPNQLFGAHWEEDLAFTVVFSSLATLALMGLLRLRHEPYSRAACRPGIPVTVVAFAAFMVATWLPDILAPYCVPTPSRSVTYYAYGLPELLWATAAAIAIFGGLPVLCLIGLGAGEARRWRWAGVAASVAAGIMWLFGIWTGVGSRPGTVVFCVLASLAASVAYVNLLLMCPLHPSQKWVRQGTIGAGLLAAGLIDLMAASEELFSIPLADGLAGRLAGAAGILTACGTIALLVLLRINRGVDYEPISLDTAGIDLTCPRCRKRQTVRMGQSSCAACGLRISIRVEEPRCPQCGYLLFQLTSDRCPECGQSIEAVASTT